MCVVSVLPSDWILEALLDTSYRLLTEDVNGQTELGCRHNGCTYSGSSSYVSPHEVHVCRRFDGDANTMGGYRTMYNISSQEEGQSHFLKKNT